MIRIPFLLFFTFLLALSAFGQVGLDMKIITLEKELEALRDKQKKVLSNLETLKLDRIKRDLDEMGLPTGAQEEQVVRHRAMALSYVESHEQPSWVAHIITPEIGEGNLSRTNDFREDAKVETGTALLEDYWDSGYDRGHMAPSADFRWSSIAISESYMYSNMSPQHPDLNREIWADLENKLREEVLRSGEQVYVATGPILRDGLPTIGESKVSIPEFYYKVALDVEGGEKKGIGFIIPNKKTNKTLLQFAVTIDEVERRTGLNFFPSLDETETEKLEGAYDLDQWLSAKEQGEARPIDMEKLPKGYVNTTAAQYHIDNKIGVCGKVVSAKYSQRSGATFLNLDRKFPNQVFTITIWKDARANFSYKPDVFLLEKEICVTGNVKMSKGTPTVNITHEKSLEMIGEVIK